MPHPTRWSIYAQVIKGGMALLPAVGPSPLSVNPVFEIGPLEPLSVWKSTSELG